MFVTTRNNQENYGTLTHRKGKGDPGSIFDLTRLLMCWREGEILNIWHQIPKGRLRISNALLLNVCLLWRELSKENECYEKTVRKDSWHKEAMAGGWRRAYTLCRTYFKHLKEMQRLSDDLTYIQISSTSRATGLVFMTPDSPVFILLQA